MEKFQAIGPNSNRGIASLLSIVGHLYAKILNAKIVSTTEKKILDVEKKQLTPKVLSLSVHWSI